MTKESLTSKVATLTERINNLIEVSRERHKETISRVDNLCNKVNHQFTELGKRVTRLEERDIAELNKYKGRVELFKWINVTLGVILGVVGVLNYLGYI